MATYNKQKEKRQKILDQHNETAEPIPEIDLSKTFYVSKKKHRPKLQAPYSTVHPEKQDKTKITGKTDKQNETSTHLKFVKRIRKCTDKNTQQHKTSLQDDPIPGTSGTAIQDSTDSE